MLFLLQQAHAWLVSSDTSTSICSTMAEMPHQCTVVQLTMPLPCHLTSRIYVNLGFRVFRGLYLTSGDPASRTVTNTD